MASNARYTDSAPEADITGEQPPAYRIVDINTKPVDKRLRFEDDPRHSIDTAVSDFNNSVYDEPAGSRQKATLSRWSLGIMDKPTVLRIPGTFTLVDDRSKWDESHGVSPAAFSSRLPPFQLPPKSAVATPGTPRAPYQKRSSESKIILVPQPENSANDPLNWPSWRREASMLSLAIFSCFGGSMASVFTGGLGPMADLHLSTKQLGLTSITYLSGLALGHILQTPFAQLYGKRLVYLYSNWLFFAGTIICALSGKLSILLVGRGLMGFALSPMFDLVPSTIAEVFPLHQRGRVLTPYFLLLLGSIFIAPIIGAVCIRFLNWRWMFVLAFCCAVFPSWLIFFLVPESYWGRSSRFKHTKQCTEDRRRAENVRMWPCRCLATGKFLRVYAQQDLARQVPINEKVVTQRERVLAKLQARSGVAKTQTRFESEKDVLKSSHFETVELSPAEAEIAMARQAFEDSSNKYNTPGQRRSFRPPRLPVGPRPAAIDGQRPTYLRFVPAHVWSTSRDSSGIPSSPCPSPLNATVDGPHGRSSLANVLNRPPSETDLPSPPRSDTSSERRANLPRLRIQTPSVLFDRENPRSATPHPWSRPGLFTASAEPPTSLPATPLPYPISEERHDQPTEPPMPRPIIRRKPTSLYTERLRLLPRRSWASSLHITSGRLTDTSFLRALVAPFTVLSFSIIYPWILYTLSTGLLLLLPRLIVLFYSTYIVNPIHLSALTLAPLAGILLTLPLFGWATDRIALSMARKAEGVFEPEFRFPVAVMGAAVAAGSIVGLGWARHIGCVALCLAGIGAGGAAGALAATSYVMDVLGEQVAAGMTLLALGSCLHGILGTVFLERWVMARGMREVCIVLAGVQGFAVVTALPAYVFGKRARARGARRSRR